MKGIILTNNLSKGSFQKNGLYGFPEKQFLPHLLAIISVWFQTKFENPQKKNLNQLSGAFRFHMMYFAEDFPVYIRMSNEKNGQYIKKRIRL